MCIFRQIIEPYAYTLVGFVNSLQRAADVLVRFTYTVLGLEVPGKIGIPEPGFRGSEYLRVQRQQ